MQEYLKFAQELAEQGGNRLKKSFGKLKSDDIESKGSHDLVTALDKEIEQLYVSAIKKRFPGHGIIGEEGAEENKSAEYVWVLDPLDGTRNYSIQVPFYATTLCLLKNNEPILAVISVPPVNKIYLAMKGEGALLNGSKITVSKKTEMLKSSILYCHTADERGVKAAEKYAAKLKLAAFNADRLRTAGGEMGLVAEGLAEAYLLDGLPVWDLAAGALLIREAGGRATDFTGKDWVPGDQNILVSNGTDIHEEVLKIINT
ncbi:inositol monophosphatase [Candidatus Peregrinibacteria bacterium]|nr:inositol monophosphatase [Candidatus Peregrinibacteria bacterium]